MTENLNCLIVEDEVMARKSLSILCQKIDNLNLVDALSNAEEALPVLESKKIDLLLLDIEMPGMSGIELLEQVVEIPQVIFTTGNKQYAYEAFEYDVTDFLKKPITQPRFIKAINKAFLRHEKLNAIATASENNEIYVKSFGRYTRLLLSDILYFENQGDYINVVTDKDSYVIHGSLKSVEAKINHPRFLKVHRSYIINLDKIVDIEDNSIVISSNVIPISRAHKPILMRSLNIL